jgi:hypothetical protein
MRRVLHGLFAFLVVKTLKLTKLFYFYIVFLQKNLLFTHDKAVLNGNNGQQTHKILFSHHAAFC